MTAPAPLNDQLVDDVLVGRVVDDLKVDRALTPAEKASAARRMSARGFGRNSICVRLGVAHRDVARYLDGPGS